LTEDRALILEVKGNSLDDGPGIRTVVFFKGCPLSCDWCHNPESKRRMPELSFDGKACIGCGTCLKTCAAGALGKDNRFFVDREKCNLCFDCVDSCPACALQIVGKEMPVEALLEEIMKDEPFFRVSRGGVTLSGGEPLLYMKFVSALAASLKDRGVHVLLETCGLFDIRTFEDLVLPYIDTVYMDIKLMDDEAHRRHCGAANKGILENLARLPALSVSAEAEFLARVPLVPGVTATEPNLSAIGSFLKENGIGRVELLAYNPLWHEKCEKIGERSPYAETPRMSSWMPREEVDACRKIFLDMNIEVV